VSKGGAAPGRLALTPASLGKPLPGEDMLNGKNKVLSVGGHRS